MDGDGKLDVLVGDSVRLTSYPDGLSKEASAAKQAGWQARYNKASQESSAAAGDAKKLAAASRQLQAVYAERSSFVLEESTGCVWLYVQM